MPYAWHDTAPEQDSGAVLHLWPNRSLPAQGFVWVIGLTAGFLALPLLAVLGTAALWGVLPFAALAVWALWAAIRRSYRGPSEVLQLSRQALILTRSDPGRADRVWRTDPYWVRLALHHNHPIESYLTLTNGQREIELAAFLSPEERVALHDDLQRRLLALR